MGVTASFPALNARHVTIALGVIGVSAGLLNILDSFVTFLFYLSVVFIPVAGVIIIDHFLIRPGVYRVTQVEDDQPINRPALVAWLVGATIALAGAEGLIASITSVAALDSAIASGLIYALVTRVWTMRP